LKTQVVARGEELAYLITVFVKGAVTMMNGTSGCSLFASISANAPVY
jgi:hypothetical protein